MKRIIREARDAMTPVDPELDALPREVNPTATLPGAVVPSENDLADDSGYEFWMRDGVTPYRSKDFGLEVFSQADDGWMVQMMVDPDSLWPSTANEVAGAIGGQGRLDEPGKGAMPFTPGPGDDLEESAEYEWVELEEGAEAPTGAMVALYPHPDVAEKLAVKGGEDPSAIHVTLAFLGKAAEIEDPEGLVSTVKGWAKRTPPLHGEVSGHGTFTAGPEPVSYISPDLPDLPAARQDLVDSLKAGDHPVAEEHGFSPHASISYSKLDPPPDHGGLPLHFTHASVVIAGDRQDFKLGGKLQEADSSADTPPVDANPPGDPSTPDDEQVDSSMSEQEIRDAGLCIDLPAESPDAKPITYKATGQQEWTPPPGWRVGLPTIDPDLAADLGVPTDLGVPPDATQ